jgi:5-methylcytosine-specific restriction enzyme subunit McrC
MASIPIANIYYLLCYAWNEFAPREIQPKAAEEFSDTLHLFSRQLATGIQSLHKRGFETGYIPVEEATSNPRGRILMTPSIRTMTSQPRKLYCAFDEMSVDIRTNQILKSMVHRLLTLHELESSVRRDLRQAGVLLRGVQEVELTARMFQAVRLHQNNRLYGFLLTICRFLLECMESHDTPGHYRFREVDRDEKRMRRVFEKFVRNFFARRQKTFKVRSEKMDWGSVSVEGSDLSLLPVMVTDASLRSTDRTIIVECKYTEKLFNSRFGSERLRSSHLYQLSAYLRNLEQNEGADRVAEGILLYPTAGKSLDVSYRLHGHSVRIRTLDLNLPWIEIENQMLSLIGCSGLASALAG